MGPPGLMLSSQKETMILTRRRKHTESTQLPNWFAHPGFAIALIFEPAGGVEISSSARVVIGGKPCHRWFTDVGGETDGLIMRWAGCFLCCTRCARLSGTCCFPLPDVRDK